MTEPADVRNAAAAGLVGATMADERVYTPLDWDTWDNQYPVVMVRAPSTDRESLGRGAPQFTVVTELEIVARVEFDAADDFTAAMVAERLLEAMEGQIVRAVINYPALMSMLQQYPSIRSRQGFSSKGEQHLGELVVNIGCEFYQGPEDFYPTPMTQLQDVRLNDPAVFPGLAPPSVEADVPISQP